jgi:hypothetical protein
MLGGVDADVMKEISYVDIRAANTFHWNRKPLKLVHVKGWRSDSVSKIEVESGWIWFGIFLAWRMSRNGCVN